MSKLDANGTMSFLKLPDNSRQTRFVHLRWNKRTRKFVSRESLSSLFSSYGNVEHVELTSQKKKGAFITFSNIAEASAAVNALNMKICHPLGSNVIFLRFADRLTPSQKKAVECGVICTSSTKNVHVPGLRIVEDFISTKEERDALAQLDDPTAAYWQTSIKRRVTHFVHTFSYDTNEIDPESRARTPDMPSTVAIFARRLEAILSSTTTENGDKNASSTKSSAEGGIESSSFRCDQCTANEYLPGQGIAAHVDTSLSFTDSISSLCLNRGCVITFRHLKSGVRKHVYHKPRMLIIMAGASRYEWTHHIASRKCDVVDGEYVARGRRVSLTFRQIRRNASTGARTVRDASMCAVSPEVIERRFVHAFYECTATHFSKTRIIPWPPVVAFVEGIGRRQDRSIQARTRQAPSSVADDNDARLAAFRRAIAAIATADSASGHHRPLLLDVGCGNGKYFESCRDAGVAYVGGDRCQRLLTDIDERAASTLSVDISNRDALRHHSGLVRFDAMDLPFADAFFDACMSIALIHHVSSEARRVRAIEEMLRVTRVGGLVLVSAWTASNDGDTATKKRPRVSGPDRYVPWAMQSRYAADQAALSPTAQALLRAGEVDLRRGLVTIDRYCHLFEAGELTRLISKANSVTGRRLVVLSELKHTENYYCLARVVAASKV